MQVSPIRQEKEKTSQFKRRNKTVLICRHDCMCKKNSKYTDKIKLEVVGVERFRRKQ